MSPINVEKIISFSSEDPVHVCSNILSCDSYKKWKCQSPGEKAAIVVLQFEKASVISGVDIGNEHSAFVEVLVSRSGASDDYKVLLVTSSFMTPVESRSSQNINKVRMFNKDQLSKPECEEKWDRIKIVCTQPFNKHVQYGLSFVKFHTIDNEAPASGSHIGKFTIRPESPESFSAGSLFSKRKEFKQDEKLSGAAAIRNAMRESASPVCKPKLFGATSSKIERLSSDNIPKAKPRNRDELLYSKDEEERHDKIDRLIEKKTEETKELEKVKELQSTSNPKTTNILRKTDEQTPKVDAGKAGPSGMASNAQKNKKSLHKPPMTSNKIENDSKRKKTNNSVQQTAKKIKVSNTKPFAQLLEGVTLVISGIQNPDRANLRTKALEMGAKYKPDWNNACTHLICAFVNTPKFNQVKGKGKIVKRTWIEDCHSQRKRLPWRRYALDRNDKGDESEEEICEEIFQESTKELIIDENDDTDNEHIEEGSDTEERVARILREQEQRKHNSVYDADTDDEMLKFLTRGSD